MYMPDFYTVKEDVISGKSGNVEYSVYYPVISAPKTGAAPTINNFSQYNATMFEKNVQTVFAPSAASSSETLNVSCHFQVMYQSRFMISFKYLICSYDKHLHSVNLVESSTWNTHTGSAVRLGELFRSNVRHNEIILYTMCSKIREACAEGENFYDDWQPRLYSSFNPSAYYVCAEGIVFYFPPGMLKSDIYNSTEILIPFRELCNQLKTGLLKP
ncbi:MAG: hypothetical protein Q8873_02975 [Bacillota bacterium]|nr:hypothetical protein [Bacillota bacterium]